jgi:pyruvate/2-oxoglutarate dehydrogenase complex dihydrolipoamide dehydrogenase (E3) component
VAEEHYDLVILGSGQAGNPLAVTFAEAGKRVALVERAYVSGTCINYGCTPTKTMVASAQRAYLARTAPELGVHTGEVRVDMVEVRARKRRIVEDFRARGEKRFAKGNPELIRGDASFIGPKEILVALTAGGERRLRAEMIVIDTGTSPLVPDVPGLKETPFLDNVSLMELAEVPEHLVVLGGGYIAVEFGHMFRRFGSRVTILERGKQILGREDADIAGAATQILREDGIDVLTGARAERVSTPGSGQGSFGAGVEGQGRVRVELAGGRVVEGSHLLVAVGRGPNTEQLNLPAAGVETDERGFICVDEQLRTRVNGVYADGIYATGDVNGGPAFTHVAYDDFRILRDNLLKNGHRRTWDRTTVYVVYMEPQLGRVGMTEAEARAQAAKSGRTVKVAKMPMASVARAVELNETRGLMKVVVDAESKEILGAAILGDQGGEIMSMLEIAMIGGVKYTALMDAVLAHPAYAEALNNVFLHLED